MNKEERRYSLFASIACILAIVIAVLFFVQILTTLDVFMTVNFVTYFVGLALIFTGMYCREKNYRKTKNFAFLLGTIFILLSLVLLVYGYASGNITF